MIQKSTAIVRGRVVRSSVSQRGPVIYTFWRIQVAEQWKGGLGPEVEVATPGGAVNGLRQAFSGAPSLTEGVEYVLFLWTGKNKLNQVMGLSQGLFDLKPDSAGVATLSRPASTEVMLDARTGREIGDEAVRMRLSDLSERIRLVLGAARQ